MRCTYPESAPCHDAIGDADAHAYERGAPITKRVQSFGGRPSLAFDHGIGSLVDVITFGDADPLVAGSPPRAGSRGVPVRPFP